MKNLPDMCPTMPTVAKIPCNFQSSRRSIPSNYWPLQQELSSNPWHLMICMTATWLLYNPRQCSVYKTVNPRQLRTKRTSILSSKIRQSPAMYSSHRSSCGQFAAARLNPWYCPIMQDCLNPRNSTGPLMSNVKMKHHWGGHFSRILYENVDKKKLIYPIKSFAGIPNLVRLSL